ncbi:ABC transporter ATP-binding protein [Rhabdothermincola sediminis]|uniref:ABC transporter ATP-binding protein n=1 Tax=Rhabdothermincola sediminis TaxID=2751370 RepID=UPI001AA08690|nr:ABC transporter ATP-binding protein [Rhabdothermincola sediminis]
MIRFEHVSFTYAGATTPVLQDVQLTVPEGELCLVVGGTGSGKSTLLRAVNGLVPRFTGGTLSGTVSVAGRRTDAYPPRELADVVGLVGQDPAAGFVTDVVEDELAYALENLGVPPAAMRRRVEETLDLLGLEDLRHRPLTELSGGQQQRVAIAAVLTAAPRVLVLDEPTSSLDPAAAEDVLAALSRLVHDLGLTVLVAEHRLERVVQFADRVVYLPGPGCPPQVGEPAEVMRASAVAPPVVELGRRCRWDPLPLSVRDARRLAAPVRDRLAALPPPAPRVVVGDTVATVAGLVAAYGALPALRGVDLDLRRGEVVALMGRNGAGKSTLLAHLAGLRAPLGGQVRIGGQAPHRLPGVQVLRLAGLVPQDPGLLLFHDSVAAECRTADRDLRLAGGTTARLLERLLPGIDPAAHPRDLSEGQRLAVAMAVVLAAQPALVLLDEPTRGLDYAAKHRLVGVLRELAAGGRSVVLATHDVEVAAQVADRVVVLAAGEVVADGPAREVVVHSPVFAPQVAKVLAPASWLTVDEVNAALAAAGSRP